MANQTANLDAPYISQAQSQPEVVANSAFDVFDGALGSLLTTAMSDANYTLNTSATPDEVTSYLAYKFTGALTADRNIIIPLDPLSSTYNKKLFAIWNDTSGGYNLTLKTNAGTGVAVAPSGSAAYTLLYCDGTNVVSVGASGGGGGTVTHTGNLDSHKVVVGNGSADENVIASTGTAGQVLTSNGASADPSFQTPSGGTLASDSDVSITSPTDGQVLMYDSMASKWENKSPNPAAFAETVGNGISTTINVVHSLNTLDVSVEVHDIASGAQEPATTTYTVVDVNTVSITFLAAPASNSKRVVILAIGGDASSGDTALSQLTDVSITSPTDGQVLTYDSLAGKWENQTPSGGGGNAPTGSFHAFGVSQPGVTFTFACSPVSAGGSVGGPFSGNGASPGPPPYGYRLQAASTSCSFSDQALQTTPATMAQIQYYAAMGQTATFRAWLGICANVADLVATNPAAATIAFRFDSSVDTHWKAYVGNGSVETVVDTGIAPDVNFHQWKITQDGTGGWNFYIDGFLVANIPTGSTGMPSGTTFMYWAMDIDSATTTVDIYLNSMQWWSIY